MQIVKVASAKEQLEVMVDKLRPEDGDVIVVKSRMRFRKEQIELFSKTLKKKLGDRNITVLLLEEEVDLKLLSEEDMRRIGWVRVRKA